MIEPIVELLIVVAVVALAGLVLLSVVRAWGSMVPALRTGSAGSAERDAVALVDQSRTLAWEHREINPELSVIILDEIRLWERSGNSHSVVELKIDRIGSGVPLGRSVTH